MKIFIFFISLATLLVSGQSSPTPQLTATIKQAEISALPTITSQEFLEVAQATIAAQNTLKNRFTYYGLPKVIRLEKMSYEEYAIQINQPPNQPNDLKILSQPKDLKVWFFVFYNKSWKSKPPTPDTSSFLGCVWVVVNAENGSPVEVGAPLSTGIVNECDK